MAKKYEKLTADAETSILSNMASGLEQISNFTVIKHTAPTSKNDFRTSFEVKYDMPALESSAMHVTAKYDKKTVTVNNSPPEGFGDTPRVIAQNKASYTPTSSYLVEQITFYLSGDKNYKTSALACEEGLTGNENARTIKNKLEELIRQEDAKKAQAVSAEKTKGQLEGLR